MKKVIIIGAGPAGITAAHKLLQDNSKDYEVTILEATEDIGGISRTVKYNGNRMDIGGHRFFSKDDEVMNYWFNLMPVQGSDAYDDKVLGRSKDLSEGGPDPEKEDVVMLVRDRVSRIYYKKKFFDYPVSLKWETIKNMGFGTTVVAGFSYIKASIFKKPETSLENFYINRFGKKLYSMFFEGYTEKLWGRHPSEISADWGSQRVKGLSIRAIIKDVFSKIFKRKKSSMEVETSLIEKFYYPKFGPGQLWETAANKVRELGGTIIMNATVTGINNNEDGTIKSITYTKDGNTTELTGDIFISSMPVKDLINGMNNVPSDISEIANGLPYRDFVTVGVLVDKLNLVNKTKFQTLGNIVPDCWIYVQDPGIKLGRIQIFNNWSPYLVKDVDNKVWIGLEYFCNETDDFYKMSNEECINFAANELIQMGIINSRDEILDAHRENVKKAYPAYFDTYSRMDELVTYLDGYNNLYCVGRNGQHRYNNMDHSMATSFEAVKNITTNVTDKSNIWNVNTEGEYHESK